MDPYHVNYAEQARVYSILGCCLSFYELAFSADEFATRKFKKSIRGGWFLLLQKILLYSKVLEVDALKISHRTLLFSPKASACFFEALRLTLST